MTSVAELHREEHDAPPSYESEQAQSKGDKDSPIGLKDFCKKTLRIAVALGVGFVLPIAMVIVGVIYIDDCPTQRFIPIFLMVLGSAILVYSLGRVLLCYLKHERIPDDNLNNFRVIHRLTVGLMFVFFIAGTVCIYLIHTPNMKDEFSPEYCHPVLYRFTFWFSIVVFIIAVLALLAGCCIVLLCCYIAFDPVDHEEAAEITAGARCCFWLHCYDPER